MQDTTPTTTPTPATTTAFYQAAFLGLVALERHEPTTRRFGTEADAAWAMFHGHLDEADRIDLLIRDAAVRHPAAFAPRSVFGFEDLPDDEPFGPAWSSPFGSDSGRRTWKETLARLGSEPAELWRGMLAAWDIEAGQEPREPDATDATTRLVAIGVGAVAALAPRFLAGRELDWGRQVISVAGSPAGVQLAGLVPICAGTKQAAQVVGPAGARSGEEGAASSTDDLVVGLIARLEGAGTAASERVVVLGRQATAVEAALAAALGLRR